MLYSQADRADNFVVIDGARTWELFEFSALPAVLVAVDSLPHGEVTAVSCAARTLFGLADGDLVGGPASQLVGKSSSAEWGSAIERLTDGDVGDTTTVEIALRLAGDTSTQALACLRRSPSGDVLVQFVTERPCQNEVTEQKAFRAALLELGDLAYDTESDDDFYQRLLQRTVGVIPGAEGGSILFAIPHTTTYRFAAAVGYDLAGLQQNVLDKKFFFRDTENPNAEIVDDVGIERSAEITAWLERYGRISEIKSNVSAPVLVDGAPVAFLSLDNFSAEGALNETAVEMMTVLARLIGDLHVRRRLESELRTEREAFRQLSLHDPLTGLSNRRHIEQSLDEVLAATSRRGRPLGVLFVDLDDFKDVNDNFGHDLGDQVLAGVAEALKEAVRTGDLVGRWGGDEFVILPSRLDSADEAVELGERILHRFEQPLELADGSVLHVSLTVGVAWSNNIGLRPDQLVRTADEALYEAKAAGKGTLRLRKI